MSHFVGHFSLWGDFEADEITKSLGLQPSAVYPKGDTFEGAEYPAKISTWDCYCPSDLTSVEQVRFLLDTLRPSADVLRHLSEEYTAKFNVSCEDGSVFSLSAGDIQELANLGVGLDIFLHEDEAREYIELTKQQCDLLISEVPNEIINGFKVHHFEDTIGVSEEEAKHTFVELRMKHTGNSTSLDLHQALIYRNALAMVLQELGTEGFQTRTGHTHKFGQTLLEQLGIFVSESQTQGKV